MSIRNRLLVLLLVIALTPLVVTSLLQQGSIRFTRDRLGANTRRTEEANARQELQDRLQSDVMILELDRQLADVQLRRQAREVEQRLATITPPARPGDSGGRGTGLRGSLPPGGPGGRGGRGGGPMAPVGFAVTNMEFGLDPNLVIPAEDLSRSSSPSRGEATSPSDPNRGLEARGTEVQPSEPNASVLKVNYKAQSCFVARGDGEALARQEMEKLAGMTSVCRDICTRGPTGILWLHTSLGSGLHLTYPGGAEPRNLSRYNPLAADWYQQAWDAYDNERQAKASSDANSIQRPVRRGVWQRMAREREAMQGVLSWDPFTGDRVVVRSMPVTYANGDFAGAVAMARTIPEIFSSLQLPERWGTDIQRMLILFDVNAPDVTGKASVLLDENARSNGAAGPGVTPPGGPPEAGGPFVAPPPGLRGQNPPSPPAVLPMPSGPPMRGVGARRVGLGFSRGFGRRGGPQPLTDDPNNLLILTEVMADIAKDQGGVRLMNYNGRQCLLAYEPLGIPQTAAVLVVPYEKVVGFASDFEESLLKESFRGLEIVMLVLLVVGVAAVSLAALKARNLTRPINALIEAGKQLGDGNYNAHVDIHTSDELERLGRVFNETGPKLRDHERMKRSLELASAIQHSLLPGQTPHLKNFEMAGRCVYCDETGGDYYDFIRLSNHQKTESPQRIGLAIGDVSGHGIGAALLMAGTRGLLHAEAPHTDGDLAELMTRLNRELVHDTAEETFVTLFYGILDDEQRSLVWSSAGHEPATLYRASTGQIEELPNTGMLLGVLPTAVYRQAGPVTLAPGDILVLGTDGIWEAHDDAGRFFGKDRLHRIVQESAGLTPEEICDRIIDAVSLFVQPDAHSDDITLIVVKAK
jgi:serine phosphatase RsbU (regulator of sigma subunit)